MAQQAAARPDGAQSIRRAIGVLRILAAAGEAGLGVSDIADQAGLARSTVHRLLTVLMGEGIVEQRPRTRRYALGEQLPLLALSRPAESPLLAAAAPVLAELVDTVGDTGFLTVRSGLDTVCLMRRLGSFPIQVLAIAVGARRPLGVSAAGLAILARLPAATARSIIQQNQQRLRPYHVGTDDALQAIARARERKYVLRERGLQPGTRAIAVAVGRGSEGPVAALTIATIARRLTPARLDIILAALTTGARTLEARLGDTSPAYGA